MATGSPLKSSQSSNLTAGRSELCDAGEASRRIRPIPPSDPDFRALYARRNDAESVNRAFDDTLEQGSGARMGLGRRRTTTYDRPTVAGGPNLEVFFRVLFRPRATSSIGRASDF